MTRGCVVCQASPAKKSVCCGQRLCEGCADSVKNHDCPRAAELEAISADPKKRKEWLAAAAGEEGMTPAVVEALNELPEIEMAWQSRKRGGVRANDAAAAVADVTAISRPDGLHIEVELKGTHKDGCSCESCAAQRDRGQRVRGAGGIYVDGVRSVQQASDGVRMALARVRGRKARTG